MSYYRHIVKHIPENVDIQSMLSENPPLFTFHIDEFHYVLGVLYEFPSYDSKKYTKLSDFIQLNAVMMRKCGIYNFPKICKWLIEQGIIETDNHYIPNGKLDLNSKPLKGKSRGFRFTKQYRTRPKETHLTKTNILDKHFRKFNNELMQNIKYKELKRWFEGLEINYKYARDYLYNKYFVNAENIDDDEALRKFDIGVITINKIKRKDFHFSVDTTAGRLHTNLTNLMSELRNYLTYDGEPLVSIDIRNSQPVLSTLLFDPNFWQKFLKEKQNWSRPKFSTLFSSKSIEYILNYLSINNINHHTINSNSIMLSDTAQTPVCQDINKYIRWCQSGMFYDNVLQSLIHLNIVPEDTKRKQVKSMMFLVLFSSNRRMDVRKSHFMKLFKGVSDLFELIKEENHKSLPILLQQIESDLMLNKVAKRISNERPSLPIYTIHDSIVTTKGNEFYVKQIMEEEFCKMIGITPSLEIKHLIPKTKQLNNVA